MRSFPCQFCACATVTNNGAMPRMHAQKFYSTAFCWLEKNLQDGFHICRLNHVCSWKIISGQHHSIVETDSSKLTEHNKCFKNGISLVCLFYRTYEWNIQRLSVKDTPRSRSGHATTLRVNLTIVLGHTIVVLWLLYLTTQLQNIVIKNGKQFCNWTMGGHLGQVEHPGSDTVTYVEVLLRQVDHLEGQARIR